MEKLEKRCGTAKAHDVLRNLSFSFLVLNPKPEVIVLVLDLSGSVAKRKPDVSAIMLFPSETMRDPEFPRAATCTRTRNLGLMNRGELSSQKSRAEAGS
jgi:hypothetical protein